MNQIKSYARQPIKYRARLLSEDVLVNPPEHIRRSEAKKLHEDGIPELFRDIQWLRTLIGTLEPGLYTAKQLFDRWWGICRRPREYGKRFKEFVLDGNLSNIRLIGKLTNGSLQYEIY